MAQKQRILVVDDQKAIADTLAVTLAARGFDVCVAYGGIAAAELALRIAPDVVIGDVVMPDKNGIELALEIAEKLPHWKVLLFSEQLPATNFIQPHHYQTWQILDKRYILMTCWPRFGAPPLNLSESGGKAEDHG